jgi:hypothetical protein
MKIFLLGLAALVVLAHIWVILDQAYKVVKEDRKINKRSKK